MFVRTPHKFLANMYLWHNWLFLCSLHVFFYSFCCRFICFILNFDFLHFRLLHDTHTYFCCCCWYYFIGFEIKFSQSRDSIWNVLMRLQIALTLWIIKMLLAIFYSHTLLLMCMYCTKRCMHSQQIRIHSQCVLFYSGWNKIINERERERKTNIQSKNWNHNKMRFYSILFLLTLLPWIVVNKRPYYLDIELRVCMRAFACFCIHFIAIAKRRARKKQRTK